MVLSVGSKAPFPTSRLAVLHAHGDSVFKFDVGEACSVHVDTGLRFVEDALDDDATAVLFKPTPLDPGLCSKASVFDGQAERDGLTDVQGQGDVLHLA